LRRCSKKVNRTGRDPEDSLLMSPDGDSKSFSAAGAAWTNDLCAPCGWPVPAARPICLPGSSF